MKVLLYGASGLMFGTGLANLASRPDAHWIYGLLMLLGVALFLGLREQQSRQTRALIFQIRARSPMKVTHDENGRLCYYMDNPKEEQLDRTE